MASPPVPSHVSENIETIAQLTGSRVSRHQRAIEALTRHWVAPGRSTRSSGRRSSGCSTTPRRGARGCPDPRPPSAVLRAPGRRDGIRGDRGDDGPHGAESAESRGRAASSPRTAGDPRRGAEGDEDHRAARGAPARPCRTCATAGTSWPTRCSNRRTPRTCCRHSRIRSSRAIQSRLRPPRRAARRTEAAPARRDSAAAARGRSD